MTAAHQALNVGARAGRQEGIRPPCLTVLRVRLRVLDEMDLGLHGMVVHHDALAPPRVRAAAPSRSVCGAEAGPRWGTGYAPAFGVLSGYVVTFSQPPST